MEYNLTMESNMGHVFMEYNLTMESNMGHVLDVYMLHFYSDNESNWEDKRISKQNCEWVRERERESTKYVYSDNESNWEDKRISKQNCEWVSERERESTKYEDKIGNYLIRLILQQSIYEFEVWTILLVDTITLRETRALTNDKLHSVFYKLQEQKNPSCLAVDQNGEIEKKRIP